MIHYRSRVVACEITQWQPSERRSDVTDPFDRGFVGKTLCASVPSLRYDLFQRKMRSALGRGWRTFLVAESIGVFLVVVGA